MNTRSSYRAVALLLVLAAAPRPLRAQVPLGPEFRVNTQTTGVQDQPAVAADADGAFVVAWRSSLNEPMPLDPSLRARRYEPDGTPRGDEFQVASDAVYGLLPAVAMQPTGEFVVVWIGRGATLYVQVFGRRFDAAGVPLGADFQVSEDTNFGATRTAVAVAPDGAFVVTWSSYRGVPEPWSEVLARRYDPTGQPLTGEFVVNTFRQGFQGFPAAAADASGTFGLAFMGVRPGADSDIFAQMYGSDDNRGEKNRLVNATMQGNQDRPAIAASGDGSFLVAWASGESGTSFDIRARRVTGAGVPRGPDFAVNTYTPATEKDPSIAVHPGGDFTVAWEGTNHDGSDYGVFAQRVAANGLRIGAEFQVNVTTTGAQKEVSLAPASGGGVVAVWSGRGPGDDKGVFARRFAGPRP